MLFRRYHGDGQPGAMDTALLLCTDDRWREATGRLIEDIAGSGALPEDDLLALAEHFLGGRSPLASSGGVDPGRLDEYLPHRTHGT